MDVSEDVTACLRAQDHGHPPVICLNFQGSKSNNVCTEDGTVYSLNAMHGHDVHVVCFEPGIAKREGSDSRFVMDKSVTLRAQMGDNQPAVCFQQNQREEVRNMGEVVGALTAESGMHNTNYVCYSIDSHPMDSRFELEGDVSPTVTSKLAKGAADGPLVLIENE